MNTLSLMLDISAEGDASPAEMVTAVQAAVASLQLPGISIIDASVEDWDDIS